MMEGGFTLLLPSLCTFHPVMGRLMAFPQLGDLEATVGLNSFSFKFSSIEPRLTSPAEGGSFQSSPSSQLVQQVLSTRLHHPARPSYRCRMHLMAQENRNWWNQIKDSPQINHITKTHLMNIRSFLNGLRLAFIKPA